MLKDIGSMEEQEIAQELSDSVTFDVRLHGIQFMFHLQMVGAVQSVRVMQFLVGDCPITVILKLSPLGQICYIEDIWLR